MACNNNFKLLSLFNSLKDYGYTVYEDEDTIASILADRRNPVIDLPYNRKEDMCDLFESRTKIDLTQISTFQSQEFNVAIHNTTRHYGNLMIFPKEKDAPILTFGQYLSNSKKINISEIMEERKSISVEWGDKVYVLACDNTDYFMFEGYVDEGDGWDDFKLATLSATKKE